MCGVWEVQKTTLIWYVVSMKHWRSSLMSYLTYGIVNGKNDATLDTCVTRGWCHEMM